MGQGPVPDQPHLIVVPNSLVDQVWREFRTFFKRASIDIFILPSNPDQLSEYLKTTVANSKHSGIFRIFICSHTVSFQM